MQPAVVRVLDANANRAREGFRVIEDFVRFDLDDGAFCAQIKSARHELAAALNAASMPPLVRGRDVTSDVGRSVETNAEYARSHPGHVAIAAAKRVTEALRVLEEYTKTFDPQHARKFERLRYNAYEIERALCIRLDTRTRFARVRLYVLITESLCSGPWLATAERAIEGGADCIQLREKSLCDQVLLDRARELGRLCRNAGVQLVINDRADIARLCGADGVHVGREDLSVSQARRIAGPSVQVGVSTHTLEQARAAMSASPDYIAVGPMFATNTKPQDHVPGPSLLTDVQAETSLPIVPVGGIGADNLETVIIAGARRVCVCTAVIAQPDVAAAAGELKRRLCTGAASDRSFC
ncbi:MAG: thiamine phosphate synthase [Phycisphaerae bacterium]